MISFTQLSRRLLTTLSPERFPEAKEPDPVGGSYTGVPRTRLTLEFGTFTVASGSQGHEHRVGNGANAVAMAIRSPPLEIRPSSSRVLSVRAQPCAVWERRNVVSVTTHRQQSYVHRARHEALSTAHGSFYKNVRDLAWYCLLPG